MDSNTELAGQLRHLLSCNGADADMDIAHFVSVFQEPILTALTQPAEQIADGAVGVTQRDREAAAEYYKGVSYPAHMLEYLMQPDSDVSRWVLPGILSRHAQQARAQALEEAAKLAERGFKDRATRIRIASAIRALQPHGQGGGV